jgi:ABC-type multidrug transport system fused ATPase/permease subunit
MGVFINIYEICFTFTVSVIIYAMKAMFGKRLPYFLALVALEVIVIVILILWISKGAVYDFLSKSQTASNIFSFIADWAEAISAAIIFAALVIVFISFRKFQWGRSINRLHTWARNGVVILAQYHKASADDTDSPAERYEEVGVLLERLMTNSALALADARRLRGEINAKTVKTVEGLHTIKEKLANEDESLFDDLQVVQHDFADVMILAFEFIK